MTSAPSSPDARIERSPSETESAMDPRPLNTTVESSFDAEAVLKKEFLFIIGSDRSGTTWLQSILGAHPQVATTVQLTLFHTYIPDWLRSWQIEEGFIADSRQWDMGLPVVWSQDEFHAFLREFLARVYVRVLESNRSATHILDKHPAYREHVEEIHLLLPHARFIHVVRDGRDVALSLVAAKRGLGWGYNTIGEAGAAWAKAIESGRRAARYSDRYLEVRYEDLQTAGPQTVQQVFDFCGLPCTAEEAAKTIEDHEFQKMKSRAASPDASHPAPPEHYRSGAAGDWQHRFRRMDRIHFQQAAGKLLTELGYASPDWWYRNVADRAVMNVQAALVHVARRIRASLAALVRGR